ncbi:hypothetical protein C064_00988 [Brucella suis 63/252]|nr:MULTISPECIES: hypothetical protein [Brucella]KEX98903.1 hypothetical protein IL60_0210865 [Brucella inopinata BO1]AAN29210.1 hypothetical protein BR0261 [Brucella suis 1330]AAN30001.1 hypothetical protein BR1081 [Brucella suis 1330]ABX61357.1 Hypothetical protein, conserved [Brucella canis ATCC 23365]AEM17623.1 hypothetical protein BS1330_I0262 [Brucella suis 1330]
MVDYADDVDGVILEDDEQGNDSEPQEEDAETRRYSDMAFNPWRFAATVKAEALVREAVQAVEAAETRQKKRRATDQKVFEDTVEAIICDLMHHRICGHEHGIRVSRSNRSLGKSRYRNPIYSKVFPSILDKLEYAGWIEQTVGDRGKVVKGAQTVIYPGLRLVSRMDAVDISLADMGIADQSDPIILQRPKKDRRLFGAREEYEDNERTRQFRSEMDQINGWLGKADLEVLDASDIAVDDTGAAIIRLHDPAKRKLRRYFTDSDHTFTSGGRLFGGFWQNMTKAERRDLLLIEGESCVALDYSGMGLRIAYGHAGIDPGEGDLYLVPGLEDFRSGVKIVTSAMLAASTRLRRMPEGTRVKFPRLLKFSTVRDAIEGRHPSIRHLFYSGHGHAVQFTESQIMVDVLLRLMKMEIVALPVHDAVLIAESKADQTKAVMLEAFRDHVGFPGSVTFEN